MIKQIRSQNTAFEIDDHPGNSKKILSKPGDKLILPIDSGCRFGVEENFPDILGTRSFNSRELTLGMIMLERSGNYLALAPTDTLSARCTIIRNSGNLLEAELTAQCEIIELTGELPQIIEAYRKLRSELRVTLAEKKQKLPGLDRLTRSAIIYVWHNDYEKLMYSNKDEKVKVDRIMGHGGFFKTKGVGQRYLAAAVGAPVTVMDTASEGGAWGIALLAAYLIDQGKDEKLEDYLQNRIFGELAGETIAPCEEDQEGFCTFMTRYKAGLEIEKKAIEVMNW